MVLGLKKKKGITVQVDYIVSVLEIKPWPPSIPLCSVQTVLIQWENGEHNSGFLPPGVPSLNGFEGGKIEYNEFFKLPVTLCTSGKNKASESFHKSYLEFHLYEPRKDKAVKGQLLGTVTINLAEYGIIKEGETISAPITMKKMTKGMTQTFLSVKIQPFDNEGIESVLRLMSEQCEDDSELPSDDDEGTSNSSRTPSVSDASRNSQFQIDEVLNFVAVSLNSEIPSPRYTQSNVADEHQRKQDQAVQKDAGSNNWNAPPGDTQVKTDHVENGNDDSNRVRPSPATPERDVFSKFSNMATKQKSTSRSSTLKFGSRRGLDLHGLKHMKSVKISSDSLKISAPISVNHQPLIDNLMVSNIVKEEAPVEAKVEEKSEIKKEKKNGKGEKRVEWEAKIETLEEELKEAAAIEVSLYSAVVEHVNSTRKVHSPARRLSRFYRQACKAGSPAKRASAARTIVSGLILVSTASGNDVSRLTFWLSNSIMLRAIVSQINTEIPPPSETSIEPKGKGKNRTDKKSQQNNSKESQSEDDWEEPQTLIMALEKLEAWTFSRIIESLWWQSFTPHMQMIPTKKKGRRAARKSPTWRFGLGDQEQGNFSIDLWKKAFQDAWERLCPLRASGHDCGCLPMLSRSVMEQLVNRLDVAMFNAVLRDSDEEMPTDPMSDPITDPKVLPIPCGKSSFGAGAQLKNAVGSWSSWLTDFFGDENEADENKRKEEIEEGSFKFKAFRLLNALSDLMMLPLGMLSDGSTRKEVCPLLGGSLMKRVLHNFIPDDFSPEPVPESLLEALDSEEAVGDSKEAINSFPCIAKPVYYSPVPIDQFSNLIGGEAGKKQDKDKGGSSILRKSYNSDDDLEKMNSPLAFIKVENIQICSASSEPNWMPQGKGGRSVVRYQLLQQVWKN